MAKLLKAGIAVLLGSLVGCASHQVASPSLSEGKEYYTQQRTDVVLAPRAGAAVTNRLDAGSIITALEIKGDWVRMSRYYDGSIEGQSGQVARWINANALGETKPPAVPQPALKADPRIQGIPEVGMGGLGKRDVMILYAAAGYFLETGRAQVIAYGDKSVSEPNTYYLNFGEMSNHFFRPSDIPDLDERIKRLVD